MIVELIAAAFGTMTLAVLFGVPFKYMPYCGMIGAAGWLVYSLTLLLPFSDAFCVFFATVVIVLLARFAAVWQRCPSTIFLVTGIFPLVPGARFYWAAYYLVTNQFGEAMANGGAALKTMIAIVLGIIFVFELPHRFFGKIKSHPQ